MFDLDLDSLEALDSNMLLGPPLIMQDRHYIQGNAFLCTLEVATN